MVACIGPTVAQTITPGVHSVKFIFGVYDNAAEYGRIFYPWLAVKSNLVY